MPQKTLDPKVFTDNETKSVSRKVLILEPISQRKHPKAAKRPIFTFLYHARERLARHFQETLQKLEQKSNLTFPRVSMDLRRKVVSGAQVFEVIPEMNNPNECRAFGNFDNMGAAKNELMSVDLNLYKISHLVCFSNDSSPKGWNASGKVASAHVNTSPEKIGLLIVDIMLDIAMFYAIPLIYSSFGKTLDDRHRFSKIKADFARRRGLSSYYGPINESLTYFSLASAVRTGEEFSSSQCKDYLKLWDQLFSECALDRLEALKVGIDDIVNQIVSGHRRGGQISPQKLKKHLEGLHPGRYILVMATSRPKKKVALTRVLHIFGREKWRTNSWKIFPYSKATELHRYFPYISLYRFDIPQRHESSQTSKGGYIRGNNL